MTPGCIVFKTSGQEKSAVYQQRFRKIDYSVSFF
jgi:hypothetical protein